MGGFAMKIKLIVAVMLVLSFISFCYSAQDADPIGTVVAIQGKVTATSAAGKDRDLELAGPIFLNDTIISEPGGKIQIMFDDESVISQGENSEMTIDEYVYSPDEEDDVKSKMSLNKGVFRVVTGKITDLNPDRFKVKTKMATIGIRGCALAFNIKKENEDVYVLELPEGDSIVIQKSGITSDMITDGTISAKNVITILKPNVVVSIRSGEDLTERPITAEEARSIVEQVMPDSGDAADQGAPIDDVTDGTGDSDQPTDDGTVDPADGSLEPADGTADGAADGTLEPADGTAEPTDGTVEPVDGTIDGSLDGTVDPTDGTVDTGVLTDDTLDQDINPPLLDDGAMDGTVDGTLDGTVDTMFTGDDTLIDPALDTAPATFTDDGTMDTTFAELDPLDPLNADLIGDDGSVVGSVDYDSALQTDDPLNTDSTVFYDADGTLVGYTVDADGNVLDETGTIVYNINEPDPVPTDDGTIDYPEDPPAPPADAVFTTMGGGTYWKWGLWEDGTGMAWVDVYPQDGTYLLPMDKYNALFVGTTPYVLNTSGGQAFAMIEHNGVRKGPLSGTCSITVQIPGDSGAATWGGSINISGTDSLNFTANGPIDAQGVLQLGSLGAYNLVVDSTSYPDYTIVGSPFVKGELVEDVSQAWNVAPGGVIGWFSFGHTNAAVNGVFGGDF